VAQECRDCRYLGQIDARQAGFSALYEHPNPSDPTERYSLALSTFSPVPLTRDDVLWFEYPGKYLNDIPNMQKDVLLSGILWPREPGQVPFEVFGHEALTQASGFLLPGKDEGIAALVDMRDRTNPGYTDISTGAGGNDEKWFYHRILWRDGDGDGDLDAFTCRARVTSGVSTSQFLWFANPGGEDPVNQPTWDDVTIISENVCDTMTYQVDLEADGRIYDVTFTVGYFNDVLAVYWTEDENGLWNNPDAIQSRAIDVSGVPLPDDHFFDVEVVDVNNDGRLDLLVTINSVFNGTLLVYEIPDDFRTGEYTKHVLASGFFSRSGLNGGGAPGQAIAFRPQTSMTGKPWILMSGDDEGTCYYYVPNSEDPSDWTYEQVLFLDNGEGNIVGKPSVADFDGDGYAEMFVAAWTEGALRAYTFAP